MSEQDKAVDSIMQACCVKSGMELRQAIKATIEGMGAPAVALTDDHIFNFWLYRDCMDAIRAGDIRGQFISAFRAGLEAIGVSAVPPVTAPDNGGAAVRGESVAPLVPKFAGQFDTFQEWVNKAQSRLASPEHRRAICVDAKGRRMTCGADFMKARDDGDFPVRYFWECELAPAAQWACPDCGNSQQFDHRGCIKPVSARAADAPSEPSELAETIRQLRNIASEDVTPYFCTNVPKDLLRRAADALDSQPTDATRYQRLRVLGAAPCGSKQLDAGNVLRFQGLDAFIDADLAAHPSRGEASSQPTDGGVRK